MPERHRFVSYFALFLLPHLKLGFAKIQREVAYVLLLFEKQVYIFGTFDQMPLQGVVKEVAVAVKASMVGPAGVKSFVY